MTTLFQSSADQVRLLAVRPDDSDARDFIYRPTLALLPERLLPSRRALDIVDQKEERSCVGCALAAVVNQSLVAATGRTATRRALDPRDLASERMLYEMAKRYDEWQGQHHQGSSLRGALKGWRKHGVTTRRLWPYGDEEKPGRLTARRAEDARRRPLGAFFRLRDDDLSHVQAALLEAGAVYASAWITADWADNRLLAGTDDSARYARIRGGGTNRGLHAFTVVGYCPAGFIIQNSWGRSWGSRGLAVLPYAEWCLARQDAWVARPGPVTLGSDDKPALFAVGFAGSEIAKPASPGMAGSAASAAAERFIFTGDRGALDRDLHTGAAALEALAAQATSAVLRRDRAGVIAKDIVLYAHGGLVPETGALQHARDLRQALDARALTGYSFIWKTGALETILGLADSRNDSEGPPTTGWGLGGLGRRLLDQADAAARRTKAAIEEALRAAQRQVGAAVSPVGRLLWQEMTGRAAGASVRNGGAIQFAKALIAAMTADGGAYRLHLVGHSAGAIYLGQWFANALKPLLGGRADITVASLRLLAPAISVDDTAQLYYAGGAPAKVITVHHLARAAENSDSIHVYPSSLLTYVADHLQDATRRVPILGIMDDVLGQQALFPGLLPIIARGVAHHGDVDNLPSDSAPGCLDEVIDAIANS